MRMHPSPLEPTTVLLHQAAHSPSRGRQSQPRFRILLGTLPLSLKVHSALARRQISSALDQILASRVRAFEHLDDVLDVRYPGLVRSRARLNVTPRELAVLETGLVSVCCVHEID